MPDIPEDALNAACDAVGELAWTWGVTEGEHSRMLAVATTAVEAAAPHMAGAIIAAHEDETREDGDRA